MDIKTQGPRALGFLLTEADGALSRETVTIASGAGVLQPGTVLGAITASGKFVTSPNAEVVGKEGAQIASAVLAYRVDATSADVQAVVIDYHAAVKQGELIFDSSVDNSTKVAAKLAQLRAQFIKTR
jgi:hypothetical protein